MARIKIELPAQLNFSTRIPIRITDLNYGGHVGNDTILGIIHEARAQYLSSFGLTEIKFAGTSLIMADVAIEFRSESFYGDVIIASVAAGEFSRVGFDLYYKLEKETAEGKVVVAQAKTGMVCFDYEARKVSRVPVEVMEKFSF